MAALHQRIKKVRNSAGLTQAQVGEACDPPVSKAAVALWESKHETHRTQPNTKQLKSLAKLAKVPLSLLVEEDSEVFDKWICESIDDEVSEPNDSQILMLLDIYRKLSEPARQRLIRNAQRELINGDTTG